MRVIKRYSNRKLYDTEAKQYVTLDQLADIIRKGEDIQVVDNDSNQDLTTVTLSQILVEQEKKREGLLPKSFLSDLISGKSSMVDRVRRAVSGLMSGMVVAEESIDRNIESTFGTVNGRDWRWRKANHIDDDLKREGAAIFVVQSESKVVGYITTWIDRDGGMGFIPNLAVDVAHRQQGLGRRLIQHALDHFRQLGVSHVRIETLEQNQVGQQLYPSLGFREVARQIHYCLELDEQSCSLRPPGEEA